jgi:hypothetical protein
MGFQNQMELISQTVNNPKLLSLFRLSLDYEKYFFIKSLEGILADEECFD